MLSPKKFESDLYNSYSILIDDINEIRKVKNYSLGKISQKTQLSTAMVSNTLRSKCVSGFNNVISICLALGLDMEEITLLIKKSYQK
jgi:DNA-binding phage protein